MATHHKPEPPRPAPPMRTRSSETPVVRIGQESNLVYRDLYVTLLSMPWILLALVIAVFYILINLVFAELYYTHLDGIDQAHTFLDVFFFSVQTMATIGYGHMVPIGIFTNALTTIEALAGFTFFAFIAGLTFSKFSRPTAQVLFSELAVISDFEGKPHLKIRLANQRTSSIVDVTARLFVLRTSITKEGFPIRRFVDMKVLRDHMPILRLTWTLMHPIDEDSPFWGKTPQEIQESEDEVFCTIVGLDEILSQTVHARHAYLPNEIIPDAFFEDVIKRKDTSVEIDYSLFHRIRKTPPAG